MSRRVTVTLTDAQYEILRHYASTFGMTNAYALRNAALRDLLDWYAKVMLPAGRAALQDSSDG